MSIEAAREPVLLLSGLGLMLAAAAAIFLWQRGRPPLRQFFIWGASAWVIAIVLRTVVQGPVSGPAQRVLNDALYCALAGVIIGVFDCGVPFLLTLSTRLRKAGWNQAVAFGIGFGAVDAFLAGLATFLVMVAVMRFRQQISADSMTVISKAFGAQILGIPTVLVQRVAGLAADAVAVCAVVYGVRIENRRWIWSAFAYRSFLGALATWAGLEVAAEQPVARLAALGTWVAFAAVGVAGLAMMKRSVKVSPESFEPAPPEE
jgi:uncharacterized membrane protein YhfC